MLGNSNHKSAQEEAIVYNADGTTANIPGYASVTAAGAQQPGTPGVPIVVNGVARMGICRDCRMEYPLRLNESDAIASYYRCTRCAYHKKNSFFEFEVMKQTCAIM